MNLFITQMPRWLIKNLLLLATLSLLGCHNEASTGALGHGRLATMQGKLIRVELALTDKQQTMGLSGRKKGSLKHNHGMLFVYAEEGMRSFWMPDTYFDLDIIYLDKNLKIVDIKRKVPHHPGRDEPPAIPRVNPVYCQHVLEMDSTSPLAQSLKVGEGLKWLEAKSLSEIGLKIRPSR